MKGGVVLYRGSGADGCRYLESGRSRADGALQASDDAEQQHCDDGEHCGDDGEQ
jgi:hypothetical protein